jgi:hypothetical protein
MRFSPGAESKVLNQKVPGVAETDGGRTFRAASDGLGDAPSGEV